MVQGWGVIVKGGGMTKFKTLLPGRDCTPLGWGLEVCHVEGNLQERDEPEGVERECHFLQRALPVPCLEPAATNPTSTSCILKPTLLHGGAAEATRLGVTVQRPCVNSTTRRGL